MTDQPADLINPKPKKKRGFACLTPEQRRAVAAKGGAAVPKEKRSFSQDRSLAKWAGRKGGEISQGGGRPKGS